MWLGLADPGLEGCIVSVPAAQLRSSLDQITVDQITVLSGLEWSSDCSHAYDNDTATFTISGVRL